MVLFSFLLFFKFLFSLIDWLFTYCKRSEVNGKGWFISLKTLPASLKAVFCCPFVLKLAIFLLQSVSCGLNQPYSSKGRQDWHLWTRDTEVARSFFYNPRAYFLQACSLIVVNMMASLPSEYSSREHIFLFLAGKWEGGLAGNSIAGTHPLLPAVAPRCL